VAQETGGLKKVLNKTVQREKYRNHWTSNEVRLLKNIYSTRRTIDCLPLFPRHTRKSIDGKARQLGLKRNFDIRKKCSVKHLPETHFRTLTYED